MKRFRDDRPADICFARGTFNSHPYVMGAMHEFLRRLERSREIRASLSRPRCDSGTARAARLNQRLRAPALPVRVAQPVLDLDRLLHPAVALQLDVPVLPARRRLALSWVGTGRLIFSLNYTEADFEAVAERFVAAARAMQHDGWWWQRRRD